MKRNRRNRLYLLIGISILGAVIGFAFLNSSLAINGVVNVSNASWDVYWNNLVPGSNNVTDITTPAAISQGKTEVAFNVNLAAPGDTYEFTVDAVNNGTINAMIETVSNGVYAANGTTPKALPDYLEYTVAYSDGVAIAQHQLLAANSTETMKVRVHYKDNVTASQLPSTDDNIVFKFSLTYVQADSNAVEVVHPSFANSDWATIVGAVRSGNTNICHVGDTKEVDMGSLGTHTLRIANCSTPAECSTTGFSQTACGFVVEFADIIENMGVNPPTNTTESGTNVGGWPATTIRTYVNNDVYNALPAALKSGIIDTTVVSSCACLRSDVSDESCLEYDNNGENFVSTDKLYLLSTTELGFDASSGYNPDTIQNQTRILDYYVVNNVNSTRIKNYNGSAGYWWTRTPGKTYYYPFYTVGNTGARYYYTAIMGGTRAATGASPAFRLG